MIPLKMVVKPRKSIFCEFLITHHINLFFQYGLEL